jgi:AraC-like DNA-binding protein
LSKKDTITQFRLAATNYVSDYSLISENFIYFDREHHFPNSTNDIDVFGRFWCLAICDFVPGQVGVRRLGQVTSICGPHSLWIPPSGLIDWQLGAGRLLWSSYLSTEAVPHDLPKQPIALFGRPQKRFESPTELFAFVRSASLDCQIDKIEQSNPLALRLKDKIDRDFSSNKSFQDFADELRVSHSAMTRAFRRCFDISPIGYRNKMRIFEAMSLLLLKGEKSVEACFDVGFVDISRFNRQFKRQMKSVPSQYNSCKKNSLDR